jgi:hypothetical protein
MYKNLTQQRNKQKLVTDILVLFTPYLTYSACGLSGMRAPWFWCLEPAVAVELLATQCCSPSCSTEALFSSPCHFSTGLRVIGAAHLVVHFLNFCGHMIKYHKPGKTQFYVHPVCIIQPCVYSEIISDCPRQTSVLFFWKWYSCFLVSLSFHVFLSWFPLISHLIPSFVGSSYTTDQSHGPQSRDCCFSGRKVQATWPLPFVGIEYGFSLESCRNLILKVLY